MEQPQRRNFNIKIIITFENRLDKFWTNQSIKFEFEIEVILLTRNESHKSHWRRAENIGTVEPAFWRLIDLISKGFG